jgi:hypothetical protein
MGNQEQLRPGTTGNIGRLRGGRMSILVRLRDVLFGEGRLVDKAVDIVSQTDRAGDRVGCRDSRQATAPVAAARPPPPIRSLDHPTG